MIKRRMIFLIFFLFISKAEATLPVLGYPNGSAVQVCVPSDKNSNCGGGGNIDGGNSLSVYLIGQIIDGGGA